MATSDDARPDETQQPAVAARTEDGRVVVVSGNAMAVEGPVEDNDEGATEEQGETQDRSVTEMVEQPDKVMRIGTMIRQLLDEVKAAPLDDASRGRLRDIHMASIEELKDGLAPELVEELERLSLPFTQQTPSDAELRIAQAQLVGWLEGLFHGIQTALFAQQMATRAQLEQMRRALPGGPGQPGQQAESDPGHRGGMYL
ncbi:bacterial proteasome activator family protein [Propionibacteriaceae bacterium Y1700]|uniref:bacterial proteasome activator family protein n=1 Tax=Microlunatus sp. Y1700 TaxID=3418487 RepID=UPI003DA79474